MVRLHGWIQTQLACLSVKHLCALVLITVLGAAPPALAQTAADEDDLFGDEVLGDEDDLFGEEDSAVLDEAGEPVGTDERPTGELTGDPTPPPRPSGEAPPADELREPPPEIDYGKDVPDSSIEELVITGEASASVEVDTSGSVTTFDAAELAALGVDDISDVAQYTPNLEIRSAGSTTATFFIRGVGLNDFTANASGSVAVYQDSVALNLPAIQTGQIFDTENVSILKGPQGAGPGRNASAGAIHVFSRKPGGEFGGFARVDAGNFGFVDSEGALDVPLWQDTLASRVAFRVTQREGLVHNRCAGPNRPNGGPMNCGNNITPPVRPGREKDLNDIDKWAARMQLRYVPEDTDLDLLLNVHGGRIDQLGTVGEHIGTSTGRLGSNDAAGASGYRQFEIDQEFRRRRTYNRDVLGLSPQQARGKAVRDLSRRLAKRPLDRKPFKGAYNEPGFEKMDTLGGFFRAGLELDQVSLSSITGYEQYDRDRYIDADYSPNRLFEFDVQDKAWQVSQDLRAEGELQDYPLRWDIGAFYLQEELDYEQDSLSGELPPITQNYIQTTWSWGVYAGLTWAIVDEFELEVGARHNWERKNFDADIRRSGGDICNPVVFPIKPVCDETRTFQEPTGTVKLSWLPSDEVTAYLKYSHGWKGAQFNARDGSPPQIAIDLAKPERIDAYEIGFNGSWLDGRLTLNGALFWYKYQDYQVFTFSNDADSAPQRIVLNADDATIYGAELEIDLEPIDRLLLTTRFGWLESRFLNFTDTGSRLLQGIGQFFQQTIDYNGNRLPNTPRFKISGVAQYEIVMERYGSLTPRYDFTWTDDIFYDPAEGRGVPRAVNPGDPEIILEEFAVGQKGYVLHNMRLSYKTPDGRIEVSGWVRNLTNEVYKSLAFDASNSVGLIGNLVGEPRTFGASVSFTF